MLKTLKPRKSVMRRKETAAALILIAPTVLGLLLFFIIPLFWSIGLSFTTGQDYLTTEFVGFDNYRVLFEPSSTMWREMGNTAVYAFFSVLFSIVIALLVAIALNQNIKFRTGFRIIYFLPAITMAAAVGMVWRNLFNSHFGTINAIIGLFGVRGPKWLTDPMFMMPGLIIVGVWSGIGYNMLILLAGLKNIPAEYDEVARLDGAKGFVKFFRITLPLLSPTLFFVTVTSVMGGFKAFDIIYTLANGCAELYMQNYRTMVYGIYEQGFIFHHLGVASAESVILLIIILVLTLLQYKVQKKWVFYN